MKEFITSRWTIKADSWLMGSSLPHTESDGDLNFVAREMTFSFLRPVYANDTIERRVTTTDLRDDRGALHAASSWTCTNQRGKEVMKGNARGIVRQ
jgi:acyl dehydratase